MLYVWILMLFYSLQLATKVVLGRSRLTTEWNQHQRETMIPERRDVSVVALRFHTFDYDPRLSHVSGRRLDRSRYECPRGGDRGGCHRKVRRLWRDQESASYSRSEDGLRESGFLEQLPLSVNDV